MPASEFSTVTSELGFRLAGHLVRDEFQNLHLKSKGICESGLCLGNNMSAEANTLLARLLQVCKRIEFCRSTPVLCNRHTC